MLTLVEKVLFTVLVTVSLALTYRSCHQVYLVIARGQGALDHKSAWARMLKAAVEWLALLPTWRYRLVSSAIHAVVAWGFVFYLLANLGDVLQGYAPITFLGDGALGRGYRLVGDLLSVAILAGMVYFVLRRFVFNSPALQFRSNIRLMPRVSDGAIRLDSFFVAAFIFLHVGSRFLGESAAIAQAGHSWDQPFASVASGLWTGLSPALLDVARHGLWWLALGAILAFIPFFPYTKHFHLIMAGANLYWRAQPDARNVMDPIDFDDEEHQQYGVARIEDLPRKQILDSYACVMCNRCQDKCPAYLTGKELSPSALEINKRYYLNDHLVEMARGLQSTPLLDYAISEPALWACTSCGACSEVCPVGNEPMLDILYMRRNQVLMESSFPPQLKNAFLGMERAGNPWKASRAERMAWAEGLGIPTVAQNPHPDVLWWVGCAPSYDRRAQSTARAFAQVLKATGVDFAILGRLEQCTGDSARRAGNEALFVQLATANIEVLNQVRARQIVVTCPHCLHTIGKEYGTLGGNFNVVHHSQFIADQIASGRLSLAAPSGAAITYHDPCYLGRHESVRGAPRELIRAVCAELVEMPRHGPDSFCCGAGGAQMWKEEEHGTEAMSLARYREASATGASTIAVACPFCLSMLTDASKLGSAPGVPVKDIAELVAERLASPGPFAGSVG